jgi:hypothetical protein
VRPLCYIFLAIPEVSFVMLNIAVHVAFSFFHPKALALGSKKYEGSVQRKR